MENIEKLIIKTLESLDLEFVYLFGSYVKGGFNEMSDVDIAFYSKKTCDEYRVFMLAQEIGRHIKRDVDLVQLRNSSTVFQKQVVESGRLIYEKNPLFRQEFEVLVLKKYMKLSEERKEIIDNYEVEL